MILRSHDQLLDLIILFSNKEHFGTDCTGQTETQFQATICCT